ncbi:hypothetical protein [Kitasatospora sp. NPDC094011]|uniref:hypothetical protein n=1 Tax=Kitasatospora sp. NPDC094011 TaxID=3364090 RepID=UPI003802C4D6
MVRRAGIDGAVVGDPRLLLDEPTVGLDPAQRLDFRDLLKEHAHGAAVILSTHLIEGVAAICSCCGAVDAGCARTGCGSPGDRGAGAGADGRGRGFERGPGRCRREVPRYRELCRAKVRDNDPVLAENEPSDRSRRHSRVREPGASRSTRQPTGGIGFRSDPG